jgi:hypothetical protein
LWGTIMGTLQNKHYDGSIITNAVQVKIWKDAMLDYLKMLSPRKIKEKSQQVSLRRTGYLPRVMEERARFIVYDRRYGNTILEVQTLSQRHNTLSLSARKINIHYRTHAPERH